MDMDGRDCFLKYELSSVFLLAGLMSYASLRNDPS